MSKDKISKHVFVPNGGHRVYFPSNIMTTCAVLKTGEYRIFPSFSSVSYLLFKILVTLLI